METCAAETSGMQRWLTAGGVLQSEGLCLTAVAAAVARPGTATDDDD